MRRSPGPNQIPHVSRACVEPLFKVSHVMLVIFNQWLSIIEMDYTVALSCQPNPCLFYSSLCFPSFSPQFTSLPSLFIPHLISSPYTCCLCTSPVVKHLPAYLTLLPPSPSSLIDSQVLFPYPVSALPSFLCFCSFCLST